MIRILFVPCGEVWYQWYILWVWFVVILQVPLSQILYAINGRFVALVKVPENEVSLLFLKAFSH